MTTAQPWPALPVEGWKDTRDTVHLWTQMVGKTRLALSPAQNHCWHVPLYVSSVGLTTSLMPLGVGGGLEIVFDFRQQQLVMTHTDGRERRVALAPRTVADFYGEYVARLVELEVPVALNPMPTEILDAIPFPDDTVHASYDADTVLDYWQSLLSAHRVMSRFRADFRGKSSPVHFFWGAFDLAVSRFSGRPAPPHPGGVPHCPDRVMVEAYSGEVSSCGYWPGGADEGLFYAYAYPEPDGFRGLSPRAGGYFDEPLGEYVLPYADVRRAVDPDALVIDFFSEISSRASLEWPE